MQHAGGGGQSRPVAVMMEMADSHCTCSFLVASTSLLDNPLTCIVTEHTPVRPTLKRCKFTFELRIYARQRLGGNGALGSDDDDNDNNNSYRRRKTNIAFCIA
jgi:hypothetical protein